MKSNIQQYMLFLKKYHLALHIWHGSYLPIDNQSSDLDPRPHKLYRFLWIETFARAWTKMWKLNTVVV